MTKRVAILISGRGSNMEALVHAAKAPDFPANIVAVVSNRPKAPGLAVAARFGLETFALDHTDYSDRARFDQALDALLRRLEVEIICLAGFMRLLTPSFVDGWRNRMINIHPALLPAYKGLKTHERALADGVKIHGASVHFVRPEMDAGPLIAQGAVCVRPDDTPETLGRRVLIEVEHKIFPAALRAVASGSVQVVDEIVVDSGAPVRGALLSLEMPGPV